MSDRSAAEVRKIIGRALMLDEAELPEVLSQDTCARWTSLYHLTLIVALEEHFGVSFTTEEIISMTSSHAIEVALNRRAEATPAGRSEFFDHPGGIA
jgi:acyl carrier protein